MTLEEYSVLMTANLHESTIDRFDYSLPEGFLDTNRVICSSFMITCGHFYSRTMVDKYETISSGGRSLCFQHREEDICGVPFPHVKPFYVMPRMIGFLEEIMQVKNNVITLEEYLNSDELASRKDHTGREQCDYFVRST